MLSKLNSNNSRATGFTLVEILIVVSIIAVLMSLVLGALSMAQNNAKKAQAANMVNLLSNALEKFYEDEGYYPGAKMEPDENAFPLLYEALLGDPSEEGSKAGRGAPYLEVKENDVFWLPDEETEDYEKAGFDELNDPEIDKFILDPFGNPIWYRVNKGREKAEYMHRTRKFDIWSLGENKKNETIPGAEYDEEEEDDIGNW